MTSGIFHTIPIDQIIVNREERQRRELTGIPELAESIQRLGLIHPVCLTRQLVLVAGERRLTAVRSLGWTSITAQYLDDLSEAQQRAVELEENIKRADIPWQDRCRAVEEYHRLRSAEDPSWSQPKTAAALGVTQGSVSQNISVARELAAGNERVTAAPKMSVALGIVSRKNERAAQSTVATLRPAEPPQTSPFREGDFNVWAKTYEGEPFNFIHCDFPYGIDADSFNQGGSAAHGGYADDEDTYWRLVNSLIENHESLVTPSAHMIFWFSMKFYQRTLDALSAQWRVNPTPLIWFKSDNAGILPDPSRGPRQVYETAFLCSRGDRKIIQAVANVFPHGVVRERHMSEKPEAMLAHFFRMTVDDTTSILDPTSGSGSALRAARRMGAHRLLGLERNPEFLALAKEAYHAA